MIEMASAIFEGDFENGERIYNQLQEAERDPVEKSRREGIYYYYLYERGNTSALPKIVELTKNPDISHYAHYWLGLCYESSQDFERAFTEHELAVQQANSQERRAIYVVSCARSLHKSGKKAEALQYVMDELRKATESDALGTLYNGIAFLYALEENYEFRGLALEKAIEYQPNDVNLLFEIAYSYSQVNLDELSLLYYTTLLNFSPNNAMALNNIGVSYSKLQMPIKSVSHQKRAFDLGNTLAASNIALDYLNAGFADEAAATIEKTKEAKEELHRNIGSTFSQISDEREKERKREKEAFEIAREYQRFLRLFGEAYFVRVPSGIDISGTWCFPDGIEVIITQQQSLINAEWTEIKQINKFKGELVNRAAQITLTEPKYSSSSDEAKGRLYVSSDNKAIYIMMKKYSKFVFKKLERKQIEASATN
jgi:tetratricopeptide (TPR) repeat protein